MIIKKQNNMKEFLNNWMNNPENGMHNAVNFTIEDVEQILIDYKNSLDNGRK